MTVCREYQLKVDILFSILYMAMVAEENKENTILGKRIERLGVHNLLFESKDEQYASSLMIGMSWSEIDRRCIARGF